MTRLLRQTEEAAEKCSHQDVEGTEEKEECEIKETIMFCRTRQAVANGFGH